MRSIPGRRPLWDPCPANVDRDRYEPGPDDAPVMRGRFPRCRFANVLRLSPAPEGAQRGGLQGAGSRMRALSWSASGRVKTGRVATSAAASPSSLSTA